MQMKRSDRNQFPEGWCGFDFAKPGSEQTVILLNEARAEAASDAAIKFSSHLDRFAAHVESFGLSAVEIVELLRQDAEKWNNQGRAS